MLLNAIDAGDAGALRAMLSSLSVENKNQLMHDKDAGGNTPLHKAAREGKVDCLSVLLNDPSCVKVNILIKNVGYTPLHLAIQGGHIECAAAILQHPNFTGVIIADLHGKTPLHLAATNGDADCMRLLTEHISCNNVLVKDKGDLTPLHVAVKNGHTACLEVLVQHPSCADIKLKDHLNNTAMHYAAELGSVDSLQVLGLHQSCMVNVPGFAKATPMHHAAERGHTEFVRLLVAHASCDSVNCTDASGKTALHYAAKGNHLEIATILLQHPSCMDVNLTDRSLQTAAFKAASNGHIECLALFIQHPSFDDVVDEAGSTIYHALATHVRRSHTLTRGHLDIVKTLSFKGFNFMLLDKKRRSAVDICPELFESELNWLGRQHFAILVAALNHHWSQGDGESRHREALQEMKVKCKRSFFSIRRMHRHVASFLGVPRR